MIPDNKLEDLRAELAATPEGQRFTYVRGWLANHPDPADKAQITAFWGVLQAMGLAVTGGGTTTVKPQVVVLLHGIRTEGAWQHQIAQILRQLPGVEVFPIGYGWFDAFRFWLPSWTTLRKEPADRILRELRDIKTERPNADLVVIAHSFSTYLMGTILQEHTDVRLSKLVLCGSIIPLGYRWDKVKTGEGGMTVVNEVGTRDIWPVLARVASWGYGPSGSMGFKTHRVRDRFFNYAHSDFFTSDHVTNFWVTFVRDGVITESPWDSERPKQPWLLGLASGIPLPKISLPLLALIAVGFGYGVGLLALAALRAI